MRFVAPVRGSVDPQVFTRPPLAAWADEAAWLQGEHFPPLDALNARRPPGAAWRFAAQTPDLLADGLHYEHRIAAHGRIATRECNWHDFFNALIWLRHAPLKLALNHRQLLEIDRMGPKRRSRAQYAMTHFDEAGVIVTVRDPALLSAWDAHDWYGLMWTHRAAWTDGRLAVQVFGHALLEHALNPHTLLVGKALVFLATPGTHAVAGAEATCARLIHEGVLLNDPLELRPLPLAGIPGWHPHNADEAFHRNTRCYQARRAGRSYPPAHRLDGQQP